MRNFRAKHMFTSLQTFYYRERMRSVNKIINFEIWVEKYLDSPQLKKVVCWLYVCMSVCSAKKIKFPPNVQQKYQEGFLTINHLFGKNYQNLVLFFYKKQLVLFFIKNSWFYSVYKNWRLFYSTAPWQFWLITGLK